VCDGAAAPFHSIQLTYRYSTESRHFLRAEASFETDESVDRANISEFVLKKLDHCNRWLRRQTAIRTDSSLRFSEREKRVESDRPIYQSLLSWNGKCNVSIKIVLYKMLQNLSEGLRSTTVFVIIWHQCWISKGDQIVSSRK
jgi:hypothetical protein